MLNPCFRLSRTGLNSAIGWVEVCWLFEGGSSGQAQGRAHRKDLATAENWLQMVMAPFSTMNSEFRREKFSLIFPRKAAAKANFRKPI